MSGVQLVPSSQLGANPAESTQPGGKLATKFNFFKKTSGASVHSSDSQSTPQEEQNTSETELLLTNQKSGDVQHNSSKTPSKIELAGGDKSEQQSLHSTTTSRNQVSLI